MTSTTQPACPECAASLERTGLAVCLAHPFDAKAYRAQLDPEDRATLASERRRGWTPSS